MKALIPATATFLVAGAIHKTAKDALESRGLTSVSDKDALAKLKFNRSRELEPLKATIRELANQGDKGTAYKHFLGLRDADKYAAFAGEDYRLGVRKPDWEDLTRAWESGGLIDKSFAHTVTQYEHELLRLQLHMTDTVAIEAVKRELESLVVMRDKLFRELFLREEEATWSASDLRQMGLSEDKVKRLRGQ